MNIFKYFQKKGYNTLDVSFYRKIEEWKGWYNGNVRGFSNYKIYTGRGTWKRCRRKTIGLAKKICEDMADLLLNERVAITYSHKTTGRFVDQVLEDNNFRVLGNEYQERKAGVGTVAYVPYLYDMMLAEDGSVRSGKIGIDYVSAENIFPTAWNNEKVTECIFAFPKTYLRNHYLHLQHHHLTGSGEDKQYVIDNMVIEIMAGSQEGKELTPEQWRQLRPFETLAEHLETGSAEPQFVIDKLNLVNNADPDESNPMGVALFANALDILRKIDIEYDSYSNEFEMGRKRIFVRPELLNSRNGTPAFDPDDSVFYSLPEDYGGDQDKPLIESVDLSLRADEHSKAITDDLNICSMRCGFGTARYEFDRGSIQTATQVISENSDMYRTLQKHELILDSVLKELIAIIIRLGISCGNAGLNPDTDIQIDFDDSIIEDKQTERACDRQDVAIGAMQLWEYRAKWYAEPEETAKAMVQMDDRDVIE